MEAETNEGFLRSASVVAPEPPAFEQVVKHARSSAPYKPPLVRLKLAVRVAVLLVGALTFAAIQIAVTRSQPAMAKLTPFKVVNAAWSAAEGYVLDFDVFNEPPRPGKYYDSSYQLNYKRFMAEAYKWADEHGLTHPDDDAAMIRGPEVGMAILKTGGMGGDGRYTMTHAQLNVRIADEELVQDLVKTLTALPGVVEPEVLRMTMYLGLGGLTPELDAAKVIINGQSFEFPEDFGLYEAQDLYWLLRGMSDGSVRYQAYPQTFLIKGSGKTTEEAMSSRFKLGDVIRLALTDQGDMTIDTVKHEWKLPDGIQKEDGHANGGGWLISIPPEVAESSVDVFAELRRKISPTPGDKKRYRYTANLETWFVPLDQVKSQGGLSITTEKKELAARLVPALEKALEDWKVAHPEVRRSLAVGDRAHGGPYRAGKLVYGFTAGVSTDDLSEFESLKAALAAVKDVPPLEDRIIDMQPSIDQNNRQSPAPLK